MTLALCQCGCGEPAPIAKMTAKRYGHVKGQPTRFVRFHWNRKSAEQYRVDPETGCWVWLRAKAPEGYGHMSVEGRHTNSHRLFYERARGPIPDGMDIDHLCRNRACVNPEHMEVVTRQTNLRRGAGTKLNPEAVRQIRRAYQNGHSATRVGAAFGVHPNTVYGVVHRNHWADVI